MDLTAHWIWLGDESQTAFNQTIEARRAFRLKADPTRAVIAITADTQYRLTINGEWVHDGPCRGWPEHYYYDELDVTPYLRAGENLIEITARHFGIGDFHYRPQRPGLLAQLELVDAAGKTQTLRSDAQWEVAQVAERVANQAKISIQNEPCEMIDARQASRRWQPATVICRAGKGPWRDLQLRDVASLTRVPVFPRALHVAQVVKRAAPVFTFPIARLLHGNLSGYANHHLEMTAAAATVVRCKRARKIHVQQNGVERVLLNGTSYRFDWLQGGELPLRAGDNLLMVLFSSSGHMPEQGLMLELGENERLINPLARRAENPWVLVPLKEEQFTGTDMHWMWFHPPGWTAAMEAARAVYERVAAEVRTLADFTRVLGKLSLQLDLDEMLVPDPHYSFTKRRSLPGAVSCVELPSAALADSPAATIIHPDPRGDVELCYDLGQQDVGYFEFDLQASEGTVIDLFGVEHIEPNADGSMHIQHTWGNRNGIRYICREGRNQFRALRRRSGRYLFLTIREQAAPVRLRMLRVIEATYPVQVQGRFSSSDARLDRLWQISNHTLKLCMEDTFTDCPLYEQTHWVGDARNEGLYAMTSYGAQDLVRRCIRLTGQSLERYPIVGGQTPSSWDMLLPAWSFLWGISVWDYYHYSGDKAFLAEAWPWVEQNLRGSEELCTDQELFSGPFWNMFDWSGIDDGHHTVLHNSLLLVGAIDAGLECARVLGKRETSAWLRRWRAKLIKAIQRQWDARKQAWPDALHEDGKPSPKTCMHTSFMAVLYGVADARQMKGALRNMLTPPREMTTIGSPFAIQYYYEALEKTGNIAALLASIHENFLPMLDADATTVWEQFPGGTWKVEGFPSRSHCHGWSSAPIYFLNRIVLGIRPAAVGGKAFTISPWVAEQDWAEGASVGAKGLIEVRWIKRGRKVEITAKAPAGVKLTYVPNASLKKMQVTLNGMQVA